MFRLIVQRVALAALALFLTSLITMAAVEALPSDACAAYLGREIQPAALQKCREKLQLDRPAIERYFIWTRGLLSGDPGVSLNSRRPVGEVLIQRIRNSFLIGGLAALIGIPLAVFLGVYAAIRRERFPDLAISILGIASMALPEFVTATVLVFIFAVSLGWLPAVALISANSTIPQMLPATILPVAVLIVVMVAHVMRVTRTNVIDQLDSEHAEFARLRGVTGWRLLVRHVLPGAVPATIAVCAYTLAWQLAGVVVVERVFNYPGLGSLMVDAINNRDLPLVQTTVLVFTAIFIGTSLLADIAAVLVNPRLRRRSS